MSDYIDFKITINGIETAGRVLRSSEQPGPFTGMKAALDPMLEVAILRVLTERRERA
jgi:hypothetical protein